MKQKGLNKIWEEKGYSQEIPSEYWHCPDCGDSLCAMEIDGQWWEKDTSIRNPRWEKVALNIRPNYSGIECGCGII